MAYNITFSPDAWADYLYWQTEDKKTLKRINRLLQELQRDGATQGLGKSEILLRVQGMSRRIDEMNRLVYTIEGVVFIILACLSHYEDYDVGEKRVIARCLAAFFLVIFRFCFQIC